MSNHVKTYLESKSLLLYQPAVEITEDRNDDTSFLSNNGQKKKQLPPIESNPSEVETLNAMFLPREWDEQGKKYIQYVSQEKASRDQAKDLFKALDEKIKERQAREKGICPVREELYAQCFDEIIRQVTIECPERGLLLLRVRDEIRMTIASYQTLYESAILFGIRKQLQAESGKDELKRKLENLEKQKVELTNRVNKNLNILSFFITFFNFRKFNWIINSRLLKKEFRNVMKLKLRGENLKLSS
jgi:dynein light intermediate chain